MLVELELIVGNLRSFFGIVCLYVYSSAHIHFTVLGVDDSK
jgi:hypothetical protein